MLEQVGNAVTGYAFYLATKQGKTGIAVTCDVYRKGAGLLVSGASASELGGGFYYYTLAGASTANEDDYLFRFHTADATVDLQDIPALWVVGRAGIEDLDALISSRLAAASYTAPPSAATNATAVWASATRTLTSFGTLATDAATAVWASATRTLTSFGTLVADVWAAGTRTLTSFGTLTTSTATSILGALTSAWTVVGTIGHAIGATYTKVKAPGAIHVITTGPDNGGIITIIPGDAYDEGHGNEINVPIASAPDLAGATLWFAVDDSAVTDAPTLTGAGDERVAVVELTAAQTFSLEPVLVAGPPPKLSDRVYWRIVAVWSESPTKPQTLAWGELRRPFWDIR